MRLSVIAYGKSEILYEESDIAIIFVGHMFEEALKVREDLKEKGYDCSLINARFIKPLDAKMLDRLTKKHRLIVTIEENVKSGGFGEHVSEYLTFSVFNRTSEFRTDITCTPPRIADRDRSLI